MFSGLRLEKLANIFFFFLHYNEENGLRENKKKEKESEKNVAWSDEVEVFHWCSGDNAKERERMTKRKRKT